MRTGHALLLLAFCLSGSRLARADAPVAPAPVAAFGDWLAACDNIADCTLYGFGGDEPLALILALPRGRPATARMVLRSDLPGPVLLRLQPPRRGVPVTVRLERGRGGTLRGVVPTSLLAAALHGGGRLALSRPGSVRPVAMGTIRLAGISAARDWIAARQRPLPSPLPQLRMAGPAAGPLHADRPPAAVVALHAVQACAAQDSGGEARHAWSLAPGTVLWSIPCGSGNFDRETLFVLAARAAAAPVPFPEPAGTDARSPGILVNAEPAGDGRTIRTQATARGLGDCGDSREYRWDGRSFRLAGARLMPACRGLQPEDWPVVYRVAP